MNPLDEIMKLTGEPAKQEQTPTSFWACEQCEATGTGDRPELCQCGGRTWPGTTMEQARQRVERVKKMQQPNPAHIIKPPAPRAEPVVEEPVAEAPKPEPVAEAPKPVEAPKQAARATRKKVEPKPVEQPVAEQTVADGPIDWKQERERFIYEHKINQLSWTPVGKGVVQTVGFTIWVEEDGKRSPVFRFMEPTDTPESFRAEYNKARELWGNVEMDVVRVSKLPPVMRPVTYQGELIARMNSGEGRVFVRRGSNITIGAKVAQTGSLYFAILSVEE